MTVFWSKVGPKKIGGIARMDQESTNEQETEARRALKDAADLLGDRMLIAMRELG
jgi:hypothetical protein